MTAVTTHLTVEQGAEWSYGWSVTYNGDPIDDTWTAASQVRASKIAVTTLHAFTAAVDASGNVTIGVTATESSAWTWEKGVYDVEVTNAAETVTLRVAQGNVTVDREVTR